MLEKISKSLFKFLTLLSFSILCYAPAMALVWINFSVSKPSTTSSQAVDDTKLKRLIDEEVQKKWDDRNSISQKSSSPLTMEDLTQQIKKESQEQIKKEFQKQAENTVKNETDKIKGEIKGDLFSQISFPVLFAIASIFAAFAVKDMLTEILKEQEKDKIKKEMTRELKQELEEIIVPAFIKSERILNRLKGLESYTNWLEYEFLNIRLTQLIYETRLNSVSASKNTEKEIHEAIDKLLNRINETRHRIELREQDLVKMRQGELVVLTRKVKSLKLDSQWEARLISKINEEPSSKESYTEVKPELASRRMEEVFDMEMKLLIATLSKIGEHELSEDLINFLYRDRNKEFALRRDEAKRDSDTNPVQL